MERLRSRQQAAFDEGFRRRVYPPLLGTCATQGFCPHPALRLYGQLPAIYIHGTLPETVGNAPGASVRRNRFGQPQLVMSGLSCTHDRDRAPDRSSGEVEIRYGMFLRYVVDEAPNQLRNDVPPHARAEVCLQAPQCPKCCWMSKGHHRNVGANGHTLQLRFTFSVLDASHRGATSTRISVLSP